GLLDRGHNLALRHLTPAVADSVPQALGSGLRFQASMAAPVGLRQEPEMDAISGRRTGVEADEHWQALASGVALTTHAVFVQVCEETLEVDQADALGLSGRRQAHAANRGAEVVFATRQNQLVELGPGKPGPRAGAAERQ